MVIGCRGLPLLLYRMAFVLPDKPLPEREGPGNLFVVGERSLQ
jgi:hypothetical protein